MTNDEERMTITDAAPRIRSGELTPLALLEQCFARIDIYEPSVHAWAFLDRERARREAERLTDEVKRGHYRGPLHGIPVGIKDIIDVFDMPTGCGSKLWANSYARRDATCVERLRQAGAVIVGKTVTTPYAFFDPPPTRNPWNLERTPGGSSSGSAAAVACGMVLAALGTQTGGSVTRPASYCGVCSIKPTFGRISVDGVLPFAPSLDHVGVMANCVRDLALVFEVVAGTDGQSGRAKAIPAATLRIDKRLSPECEEPPPRFTRLHGLFSDLAEPMMTAAINELVWKFQLLISTQARIEEAVPPAGFAEVGAHHRVIMAVEAATYHGPRFDTRPGDYPAHMRQLIEEGRSISAVRYREAKNEQINLEIQMDDPAVWSGHYLTPATTGPAPIAATTGSPVFNAPWSMTGLPTVSFPIGRSDDGMPLAVQLIGTTEFERHLLADAAWVERIVEFPRRLPPRPKP